MITKYHIGIYMNYSIKLGKETKKIERTMSDMSWHVYKFRSMDML